MRRHFPGWLVLLGVLTAIGPLSIDMYLPAFLAIANDLGGARGAVERTLPMFLSGLALGQLVYGPLSDRFGRRPPLLVGLVLYLVGTVGCALSANIDQLSGWRLVQALGGAVGVVIARAVLRDRLDPRASAQALSVLMLVMGAAPVLAPQLGSWMLEFWSWRGIFWFQAVFAIGCLLAVVLAFRETRDPAHVRPLRVGEVMRTYRRLLADPRLLVPVLAGAFGMGGLFAYIAGSPFVLMGLHGLDEQQFAMVFGLNAFGLIAASQLNGWWLRRLCPNEVLARSFWIPPAAGAAVLGLGLYGSAPSWMLMGALFAYVGSLGLITPNTGAMALADQGRSAGAASALLGATTFVIGTVSGLAVSFGQGHGALPLSAILCASGLLCGLFSFSLVRRRSPRVEPDTVAMEPPT